MKNILSFFLSAALLCTAFASCSPLGPDVPSDKTIFPDQKIQRNSLENWLLENFTYPYNVEVTYKYNDIDVDSYYTVVPADSAKAAKLAKIVKYMWYDAYDEIVSRDFLRTYSPRHIMMIGSREFNNDGTTVQGYAVGSIKIALLNVNELEETVLRDIETLNSWYLSTFHHEFCHILNQKVPYDKAFGAISEGDYVKGEWSHQTAETAYSLGFVRNYAMQEPDEDFAETFSDYLVYSQEKWDYILAVAEENAEKINSKVEFIRKYMKTGFGIDIDELRAVVQRRASELRSLDLENL